MEKIPRTDRNRPRQLLPQPVVLTVAEAKLVAGGPSAAILDMQVAGGSAASSGAMASATNSSPAPDPNPANAGVILPKQVPQVPLTP